MSENGRLPKTHATVESYGQQARNSARRGWRVKRKKTECPFELNRHAAAANPVSGQIDADKPHWQSGSTAESAARYQEVRSSSEPIVTATRPNSSLQSRSSKGRTIWRFAIMSATIAVVLLVPSSLRQGPDIEDLAGLIGRHPMQLARSLLESKPPFSDAESEHNQRSQDRRAAQLTDSSRTDASEDVASFDVTISPTITPTYENQHKLTIDINLSRLAEQPLKLIYKTLDQTAKADQDYVASSGMLTIQPGEAAAQLDIPLIDDGEIEPKETFQLMLSLDSGQTTPSNEFLVATILDDDVTTEHEAFERPLRLDRRFPDTFDVNETQSVSVDQTQSITKALISSEQTPRLPAAEASPSPIPSLSEAMEQVEARLQALRERSLSTAQPLHSSRSSGVHGESWAIRSGSSTPEGLRQGDTMLSTRASMIDQSDLTIKARSSMPNHQFRVQIAAMRNKAGAQSTWIRLQSSFGPIMANMNAHFERAETTNGIFYRIQIGQFQTRDQARDLCAQLKKRDVSCFVIDR